MSAPHQETANMNLSFGTNVRPSSTLVWSEIRKGPALDIVREHLDRVVNYRHLCGLTRRSEVR
jgi:hypothetical protein